MIRVESKIVSPFRTSTGTVVLPVIRLIFGMCGPGSSERRTCGILL
jgi:uncharacterized spore protein YtfJ